MSILSGASLTFEDHNGKLVGPATVIDWSSGWEPGEFTMSLNGGNLTYVEDRLVFEAAIKGLLEVMKPIADALEGATAVVEYVAIDVATLELVSKAYKNIVSK